MQIFTGIDELTASAGAELGSTDWVVIDQATIDAFAQATGDHQWIHVDPERAATGPFGGTIAHGFLTLSLLPTFFAQLYRVDGVAMAINYGLGKVRFPSPVPSGSRVRATSRIADVAPVTRGVQCTLETVIDIDGGAKPACVAESIVRFLA